MNKNLSSDVIEKGSLIRFKVDNISIKAINGVNTISVIGSLQDDYLGKRQIEF